MCVNLFVDHPHFPVCDPTVLVTVPKGHVVHVTSVNVATCCHDPPRIPPMVLGPLVNHLSDCSLHNNWVSLKSPRPSVISRTPKSPRWFQGIPTSEVTSLLLSPFVILIVMYHPDVYQPINIRDWIQLNKQHETSFTKKKPLRWWNGTYLIFTPIPQDSRWWSMFLLITPSILNTSLIGQWHVHCRQDLRVCEGVTVTGVPRGHSPWTKVSKLPIGFKKTLTTRHSAKSPRTS